MSVPAEVSVFETPSARRIDFGTPDGVSSAACSGSGSFRPAAGASLLDNGGAFAPPFLIRLCGAQVV